MPEVQDFNELGGDEEFVTLTISNGLVKRYMSFDEEARTIVIDKSALTQKDTGSKSILFLLADSYGSEVEKTLTIVIKEKEIENEKPIVV